MNMIGWFWGDLGRILGSPAANILSGSDPESLIPRSKLCMREDFTKITEILKTD